MTIRLFLWFALAPHLFAAVCAPGALSTYEALGAVGCQAGPFTVKNFVYSQLAGTVSIPDTAILVTPLIGANSWALNFSSPLFSVTGNDFTRYRLDYTWDPGDIRSMEDILNTSTPVFPGFATLTTDYCLNGLFGSSCPPPTGTLFVSHDGITPNLVDIDPVSCPSMMCTVDLQNTFELNANGASSEIRGFTNRINTPEPGTFLAVGFAFWLLWARASLRRSGERLVATRTRYFRESNSG